MKMFWKLTKEAARYKALYVVAILATLAMTTVNLAAPRALSAMTGLVQQGVDETVMKTIVGLAILLLVLYLLRVVFRFMSSYLTHKAAWNLVGDLRDR